MKTPYDDIIHLLRPVSKNHPPMPLLDRAAQFSPFAALVGYGDAVAETGRLTEPRRELDEQEKAELDRKLAELAARLDENPEITITYFIPDERKAGGSYSTVTGTVVKISKDERTITLSDGRVVDMADVLSLAGTGRNSGQGNFLSKLF